MVRIPPLFSINFIHSRRFSNSLSTFRNSRKSPLPPSAINCIASATTEHPTIDSKTPARFLRPHTSFNNRNQPTTATRGLGDRLLNSRKKQKLSTEEIDDVDFIQITKKRPAGVIHQYFEYKVMGKGNVGERKGLRQRSWNDFSDLPDLRFHEVEEDADISVNNHIVDTGPSLVEPEAVAETAPDIPSNDSVSNFEPKRRRFDEFDSLSIAAIIREEMESQRALSNQSVDSKERNSN